MRGKTPNNYILLMQVKCLAGRSFRNQGISMHRHSFKHPLYVTCFLEQNLTYLLFHCLRRTEQPGKMQAFKCNHVRMNTEKPVLRTSSSAKLPYDT